MHKLGKGDEGILKHYTNPPFVRESTQNMTNKAYANWVREPKGNTKHYTNPVFVWRSTQKHDRLKTCANWGRGCRENKSTIESRCLWSEENGTNKWPRGITRPRRGGDKLKQWSEQITRSEINFCKGAGFCWGVSTLAGATGGWARAGAAGTPTWTGTWASAITWFCARRILSELGRNDMQISYLWPSLGKTGLTKFVLSRFQRNAFRNVEMHSKTFSIHSEMFATFPNGNWKRSIPLKNHFKTFRKRLQTLISIINFPLYKDTFEECCHE